MHALHMQDCEEYFWCRHDINLGPWQHISSALATGDKQQQQAKQVSQ